jgi:hypothetical protein
VSALDFDKARTDEQRVTKFWMTVDRRSPDECWPWTGYTEDGYGRFFWHGRMRFAHDLALEFFTGERRAHTLDTCHGCNNPICVNLHHLRYDTRKSNVADMVAAGNAGKRRLNPELVREMRERAAAGATGRQLAADYGVSEQLTSFVLNGTRWPQAGGPIRTKRGAFSE